MTVAIDRRRLAFGENLSVRRAEQVLRELGADDVSGLSLEIDLSELRFVELGAGWRLGNALSAWGRSGTLMIEVPPPGDFRGDWFKVFTRSGLGLALAGNPVELRSQGTDVTAAVRDYYQSLGHTPVGNNNVVVRDLERRVELRDPNVFAIAVSEWAPFVGLQWVDTAPKVHRIAFLAMVREAVTNVSDHAYRTPCAVREEKLSYASFRRYQTLTIAAGAGGIEKYIEAVQPSSEEEQVGWIEIVIVDDGVGIAARHSQSPEIYFGDISAEDDVLAEALSSGVSVKPRSRDAPAVGDPGHGFTYIADGLRRFSAYAELRTGRRLLTLDASGEECDGFVFNDDVLGLMPGTALHIVFPLNSPQLRIPI